MTDLIKCTILEKKKPVTNVRGELEIRLEHQDGNAVSANEIESLISIGGKDRWKYKYGMDGQNIDTFSWSLINLTDDMNKKWLERASAVTFRTIGFLIDKKFRKNRGGGYSHFRDEFTHDLEVFDGRPSVLAQAYLFMPDMNKKYAGLTQWNDNYYLTPFGDALPAHMIDPEHYTEGEEDARGNLKWLATMPYLHINMHEKKHAFGYWHDTNSPESIMYPYAKRGYLREMNPNTGDLENVINKGAFIWTKDDIARWHEGYPKRSGFAGFIGRMRARRLRGRFVKGIPYRVAV